MVRHGLPLMYFMFHVFLDVPAKMIFEGTSQIGRRLKIGLFCMKWCLLMLSISSGYPELIVDILGWRGICIYAKFQFRASSSTTQHTQTTQLYIKSSLSHKRSDFASLHIAIYFIHRSYFPAPQKQPLWAPFQICRGENRLYSSNFQKIRIPVT